MKKVLTISLFVLFMMFVLVGCNSVAAPTNVSIENGIITFNGTGDSFVCQAKSDKLSTQIDIKSGDSLDNLKVGLGEYEIRVRAKIGDTISEWSEPVKYVVSKLETPKNVEIRDNKIYFDSVIDGDTYEVIFTNGETEVKQELNSGASLANLGLEAGEYDVSVVAKNKDNAGATSDKSAAVRYVIAIEKLSTPTGLEIADDYVFFNVMGLVSEYVLKFVSGETSFERVISSGGCPINELLIPEGTYKVSIKAKGDGKTFSDSDYSAEIDFVKETQYMELKEKDLVTGGYIKWMGRTYYNEETKANEVYHSASGFEFFFKGSTAIATIRATNYNSSTYRPCIVVVVDDDFDNAQTIFLNKASLDITLASGITDLEEHKVDLYKRSESIDSHIAIVSIKTDGLFVNKIVEKELKLEFIAASSSTGYGNLGSPSSSGKTTENSDCLKGFAFLTAQALNADINIFSASGWGCYASKWTTPNTASVADEYRNVDFNSSVKWNPGMYIPDVIVVNLGTNDWSYINAASTDSDRDARMTAFQQKYVQFLKYLHDTYPDAQIIVLYGLMNESSIYEVTESIVIMAKLAIPNIVSIKINGDAKGYNSHPSVASHAAIARTLTEFIKETLDIE